MQVAQIFKALGDPVRIKIVERLVDGSPHTIGTLSEGLGISRQGARKQLTVLESAKIIKLEPKGRETQVSLDTKSLEKGRDFIAAIEKQWDVRLNALKELLEK